MADSFGNFRRGYVDTSLGQVHYREAGSGPPIALLHQSALSSNMYDPVLPLIGRHYRAIALDTIGYGMSDRPRRPIEPHEYASNILEAMQALGVPGAFAIIGTATGAYFGSYLAAHHPDKVTRLIMNGPPLMHPDRPDRLLPKAPVMPAPRADGGHLIEQWNTAYGNVSPTDIAGFHRLFLNGLNAGDFAQSAYHAVAQIDILEELKQVRCPTFVIYGDLGPAAEPIRQSLPLIPHIPAKAIPGATLYTIEEHPAEFAEAALSFLAEPLPGGGTA